MFVGMETQLDGGRLHSTLSSSCNFLEYETKLRFQVFEDQGLGFRMEIVFVLSLMLCSAALNTSLRSLVFGVLRV